MPLPLLVHGVRKRQPMDRGPSGDMLGSRRGPLHKLPCYKAGLWSFGARLLRTGPPSMR